MAHLMVAHLVAFFLNAETLRNFHSDKAGCASPSLYCFCLSLSHSLAQGPPPSGLVAPFSFLAKHRQC